MVNFGLTELLTKDKKSAIKESMESLTTEEQRGSTRFSVAMPIRFNLNPDFHYVQSIRMMGVGGRTRDISKEGLSIDSRLDLGDVCQIFPEALEDGSVFELELELMDARDRKVRIRGAVKWYRVDEQPGDLLHFMAGVHLKDAESQAVATGLVTSAKKATLH